MIAQPWTADDGFSSLEQAWDPLRSLHTPESRVVASIRASAGGTSLVKKEVHEGPARPWTASGEGGDGSGFDNWLEAAQAQVVRLGKELDPQASATLALERRRRL